MAIIFSSLKMILLFPSFRCCISEDNYCSVSFHPFMRMFPSPRLCLTIPILQENTMKYFVENRMHVCSVMSDSLDYSPPGSSVHGIFQTRILKWVAISSSKGSSWPKDWTQMSCVSCIGRQILYLLSYRGGCLSLPMDLGSTRGKPLNAAVCCRD